ncbi:cytochrome c biogenesis protein CcsA [Aureispira anguillae]|uniref:Cytochrome c biogenesis protein CcsA n=1 Tax=Aureispira anguillae TaxID=2864201 RepID=A0A916DVD8_9BACT|nr:cytochrome c biogenesis protein CcsA [Aureispira anguillae]BDS13450.1 cytochrome c biogenesis protein CcsA [Aureispira anguillae]
MIQYIGEHLWVGQLGQFLIFLAFVTALLSTISYALGTNEQEETQKNNWRKIGRAAFITHGISIISVIVLIFFMMINKYYEYDYVWSHVSDTLPFRYTFAAFWEGQEGSFLLWLFWHSILGFVLIKTAKQWEQPVMTVLSFAQIFFVFFILGLYFNGGDPESTDYAFLGNIYGRSGFVWLLLTGLFTILIFKGPQHLKTQFKIAAVLPSLILMLLILADCYHLGEVRIGGSPFMLLRDVHFAPIFNTPNYLSSIEGTGLNPLLQNYWMTIHPPTLFLGFATTIVPCAYAVAGLWKGDHTGWMEPALKWALFSGAVLGTGIFMGGVWAYEALSFGGYWAWDPVENASLVPWITLIAGIHTTLVARATGYSTKSTYFFYLLTFFLIVYSTFLTRSGILGETSVHAFTEMGMEWQMVLFMGAILFAGIGFYAYRRKEIPAPKKEESAYSREFWMFVGALVLLFSAGLITVTTSIPVINALVVIEPFDTLIGWGVSLFSNFEGVAILDSFYTFFVTLDGGNIAPPEDVVTHHNNFQLWIGVLVAFLSGVVQFLAYKKEDMTGKYGNRFAAYITVALMVSIVITIPVMWASGILAWQYWLLVGCGIFSILTNVSYLIAVLKNNMKLAGSVLSHVGFGLMLVGVVFSGALKHALADPFASKELDGLLGDLNKQTNKNILVPYGQTVQLTNGFTVSYTKNWTEGNAQFFELNFLKKDAEGNIVDRFITTPNVLHDTLPNGNLKFRAANPNTKHYIHQDVFTLAVPSWAFFDPEAEEKADTTTWQPKHIAVGDTFYTNRYYIVYKANDATTYDHKDYKHVEGDIPVTAILTIKDINTQEEEEARVLYYIRGRQQFSLPTVLDGLGLEFKLTNILPQEGKVIMQVKDKAPKRDYVVVQALIFPGIQLVWIGCIMMMFGLLFSGVQRIQRKKKKGEEKEGDEMVVEEKEAS